MVRPPQQVSVLLFTRRYINEAGDRRDAQELMTYRPSEPVEDLIRRAITEYHAAADDGDRIEIRWTAQREF
jgi:hypothetical protein